MMMEIDRNLLQRGWNELSSKSRSKGVDRISYNKYELNLSDNLLRLRDKINSGYNFSPYKELLISKNRYRPPRLISIPTIQDRVLLQSLKILLKETFEIKFPSTHSIINSIEKYRLDNKHYTKIDIKDFFPSIEWAAVRPLLEAKLPINISDLIMKALANPTIPVGISQRESDKYGMNKGVPQGLPISSYVAHMVLESMDQKIQSEFDGKYCRFVDDILILSSSKRKLGSGRRLIKDHLRGLGLLHNSSKLETGLFSEGFSYLGYHIEGEKIDISDSSFQKQVDALISKVCWYRDCLSGQKPIPKRFHNELEAFERKFVSELNDTICGFTLERKQKGFVEYFKCATSANSFYSLDACLESVIARNGLVLRNRKHIKKHSRAYYIYKYSKDEYGVSYNIDDEFERKREVVEIEEPKLVRESIDDRAVERIHRRILRQKKRVVSNFRFSSYD